MTKPACFEAGVMRIAPLYEFTNEYLVCNSTSSRHRPRMGWSSCQDMDSPRRNRTTAYRQDQTLIGLLRKNVAMETFPIGQSMHSDNPSFVSLANEPGLHTAELGTGLPVKTLKYTPPRRLLRFLEKSELCKTTPTTANKMTVLAPTATARGHFLRFTYICIVGGPDSIAM